MDHIDSRAALDNPLLMKVIKELKESAWTNVQAASDEDHLTRLIGVKQSAILDLLIDRLEEACKVQQ